MVCDSVCARLSTRLVLIHECLGSARLRAISPRGLLESQWIVCNTECSPTTIKGTTTAAFQNSKTRGRRYGLPTVFGSLFVGLRGVDCSTIMSGTTCACRPLAGKLISPIVIDSANSSKLMPEHRSCLLMQKRQ
jgi:hypothetical protein